MSRSEKLERAGDYVLGLMEGAEQQAFVREMARDAELAGMVTRLSAQMQALDDTATGTTDPAMWTRIDDRIAALPQFSARAANDNRLNLQRWGALAASVVVALGVGYFAGQALTPPEARPTMVAVLINQSDASPGAIIEAFGDDSVHIVPLEQFEVPEGQVLQVWTLPDPATGPVSLGTLDGPLEARLRGPDLPAPASGQLYEITLEPAPGSPTGRPTGPILVKGFAKAPV
jgi:anti-sigma-K factor RskA